MNEPEKIHIPDKKVSDSLSHLSTDELRELKAQGKIIYKPMKSDSGDYCKTLDGTVYAISKGGTLRKIGMMNHEGKVVPITGLSKRDRSKIKRHLKRNERS